MDEAAKVFAEQMGPWAYIVIPAIATMSAAFAGGCWYVAKSLVRGTTFYASKLWELLEKAASKHFVFIDTMGALQTEQTKILSDIKISAEISSNALSQMGSDPMRKLEDMKAQLVTEIIEAMRKEGFACDYKDAEKVVEMSTRKNQ